MFANNNQVESTLADTRLAVRRRLLTSLIAGSGSLFLSACRDGENSGGSSRSPASSSSTATATSSGAATGLSAPLRSTIGAAVQQMQMPHEAKPNGVPGGYAWAEAPVISQPTPPSNFTAMTGWGEIQCAAGAATTATTATAELRNFRAYILDSSGQLALVQNQGSLDGSQYLPTFADNTIFPAQMTNSAGVTKVVLDPTKAFHFCPDRVVIPPGVQGVVVTLEAKISAPVGVTDPNIDKSYILALGADWWQSMTAQWNGSTSNYLIGSGRFVYMTTCWRGFTFTSIRNASASVLATPFVC